MYCIRKRTYSQSSTEVLDLQLKFHNFTSSWLIENLIDGTLVAPDANWLKRIKFELRFCLSFGLFQYVVIKFSMPCVICKKELRKSPKWNPVNSILTPVRGLKHLLEDTVARMTFIGFLVILKFVWGYSGGGSATPPSTLNELVAQVGDWLNFSWSYSKKFNDIRFQLSANYREQEKQKS